MTLPTFATPTMYAEMTFPATITDVLALTIAELDTYAARYMGWKGDRRIPWYPPAVYAWRVEDEAAPDVSFANDLNAFAHVEAKMEERGDLVGYLNALSRLGEIVGTHPVRASAREKCCALIIGRRFMAPEWEPGQ